MTVYILTHAEGAAVFASARAAIEWTEKSKQTWIKLEPVHVAPLNPLVTMVQPQK